MSKAGNQQIALVDKYENFDSLTTMLNEFVEKILIKTYEMPKKYICMDKLRELSPA